jgi:hypothetical protein
MAFYRLDPTGTQPIEPLGDLIPALTSDRVVLDMVDSEDVERSYNVTMNALQDFTSATSNVHKNPERITVSGTLVSSIDLGLAGSVGFTGLRADLIRIANLEELADAREPVLVVSPRVSMARAFIESIARSWNPDQGENTLITVSLVEARIVSPLTATETIPDDAASATGNNRTTQAGSQSAPPVETQVLGPPGAPGLPPPIGGGFA